MSTIDVYSSCVLKTTFYCVLQFQSLLVNCYYGAIVLVFIAVVSLLGRDVTCLLTSV